MAGTGQEAVAEHPNVPRKLGWNEKRSEQSFRAVPYEQRAVLGVGWELKGGKSQVRA